MNSEKKKSIFHALIENIQLIIDDIKQGDASRGSADPHFRLDEFWTRMSACMQATSDAATRLCLAYTPTPLTSDAEAEPLIAGLERSVLSLVSVYYTLPPSHGATLKKYVGQSVLGMMESAKDLLTSISSAPKSKGKGSKKAVQSTGHTWGYADKFSTLPKDNREAVVARANDTTELISDALQEIEEALAGDGMMEDQDVDDDILDNDGGDDPSSAGWSDADRLIAASCVGLVKTAKNCVKKLTEALTDTSGCTSNEQASYTSNAADTATASAAVGSDAIAEQLVELSPAVDELVSSLYPPVRLSTVDTNCQRLAAVIQSTLNSCRDGLLPSGGVRAATATPGAGEGEDKNRKWIDFLTTVVEHNLNKVQQMVNSMQSSSQ